jgi:hypothetical protein
MYSYENRVRAVELYLKPGKRVKATIRQLGYAPAFMATYNARFAKPPRSNFDVHRPLRADESLDLVLTWREPRKVTKSLTVQYGKVRIRTPAFRHARTCPTSIREISRVDRSARQQVSSLGRSFAALHALATVTIDE